MTEKKDKTNLLTEKQCRKLTNETRCSFHRWFYFLDKWWPASGQNVKYIMQGWANPGWGYTGPHHEMADEYEFESMTNAQINMMLKLMARAYLMGREDEHDEMLSMIKSLPKRWESK